MNSHDFPTISDSISDINNVDVLSIPDLTEYIHRDLPEAYSQDTQVTESISVAEYNT